MAMLTAYLDESRTDGGMPFPTIGGYIGTVDAWLAFSIEWKEVLADAGLTFFHAAECWANQKGSQFEDREKWDLAAKRRLVGKFLTIVERHGLRGVLSTLDNDAYLEIIGDRKAGSNKQGSQYELLAWSTAVLVGKMAESESPFPISFVFDEGNTYRHQFELGYSIVRIGPHSFTPYLGPVTFASDVRVVPLQAADLYAWTAARIAHDFLGKNKVPKVPWSFRLWEKVPRLENYIQRSTLEGLRENGWGTKMKFSQKDFHKIQKIERAIKRRGR